VALTKTNGYTLAKSASEVSEIQTFVNEGDKLGELWRQKLLDGAGPFE
jgi:hypothetical protein